MEVTLKISDSFGRGLLSEDDGKTWLIDDDVYMCGQVYFATTGTHRRLFNIATGNRLRDDDFLPGNAEPVKAKVVVTR